jgi:hypothetical protein
MLSLNSKHVQHVKIKLACNFKVNLITHLEVIALFFYQIFKMGPGELNMKKLTDGRRTMAIPHMALWVR